MPGKRRKKTKFVIYPEIELKYINSIKNEKYVIFFKHLGENIIDNYRSNKKNKKKCLVLRKKRIIGITLYKTNLSSDE